MKYLDTLDRLYIDFVEKNDREPKKFVCSEKTLDNILDELKEVLIKSQSKKIMKQQGVRFRGVRIRGVRIWIDNSVYKDMIYIQ